MKIKFKEDDQNWNSCIDQVGAEWGRCLLGCNDSLDCDLKCASEYRENMKICPCEVIFDFFADSESDYWIKLYRFMPF